jgi:hypothetical protein
MRLSAATTKVSFVFDPTPYKLKHERVKKIRAVGLLGLKMPTSCHCPGKWVVIGDRRLSKKKLKTVLY